MSGKRQEGSIPCYEVHVTSVSMSNAEAISGSQTSIFVCCDTRLGRGLIIRENMGFMPTDDPDCESESESSSEEEEEEEESDSESSSQLARDDSESDLDSDEVASEPESASAEGLAERDPDLGRGLASRTPRPRFWKRRGLREQESLSA